MQHGIVCQIIEKPIKLNFEKYISNICKKASNLLNTICRMQTLMGHKARKRSNDKYFRAFKCQLMAVFVFCTSVLKRPKIKLKSS